MHRLRFLSCSFLAVVLSCALASAEEILVMHDSSDLGERDYSIDKERLARLPKFDDSLGANIPIDLNAARKEAARQAVKDFPTKGTIRLHMCMLEEITIDGKEHWAYAFTYQHIADDGKESFTTCYVLMDGKTLEAKKTTKK